MYITKRGMSHVYYSYWKHRELTVSQHHYALDKPYDDDIYVNITEDILTNKKSFESYINKKAIMKGINNFDLNKSTFFLFLWMEYEEEVKLIKGILSFGNPQ
jgi:hypothetical protein